MKKILASFLSVLMVLTCIIIPGMVVSAATPEYLDHYNFSVKEGEIFDYATPTKADTTIGKVSFDPGYGRLERQIYPLYTPAAFKKWDTDDAAKYEAITRNEQTVDSLALTTSNPTVFVPMMSDGKPFELKPGTEYTVKISYYLTGNTYSSATNFYAAGGIVLPKCDNNEYIAYKIPAWDNAYLGRPFASSAVSIPASKNITETSQNTLNEKTLTFTTKPAPADSDTSYSYDANENRYRVEAVDKDGNSVGTYDIDNYFYVAVINYGQVDLKITHLEIMRQDYVPDTTVEYVVDGTVVKSETVEQGTDYAINYIHPHTDTKRFAGWYRDEKLTDKVPHNTTSISTNGIDTLRLYAKMVEYETNITMPVNNVSWGAGYYPYINANGAYLVNVSTKKNSSSGYISADADKLSIVSDNYRQFLLVARNPENGDLLVAKPGAEYKLTLKYKVNKVPETGDYYMHAGYDIAEGSTLSGSNAFAYHSSAGLVTDNNVSSEIKELSQNIVISERSGGDPFLGFRIIASKGFEVEIYELKVEEVISEDISTGEFLVTDKAENRTTYKVEFDYKLNEELTENIGIGFKTIAADDIGFPTFIEGENVAIYNISTANSVEEWIHATAFITTDMYADVKVNEGTDDTLTALNSKLYAYIIGRDNYSKISVKDVVATALDDVVGRGEVYILNENAEITSGNQALRYSFSYKSNTGYDIIIDNVTYTVKNRGFICLNGKGYALSGRYAGDINLTNAKAKGRIFYAEKSTGLENCWDYADETLFFSTYVSGFTAEDTNELMVRGYVTVECDGQTFTLYSDTYNRSVAYIKS